jgi:hypothetical protein
MLTLILKVKLIMNLIYLFLLKIKICGNKVLGASNFISIFQKNTEGSPNLSADRVLTVPYRTVFREGPFWSTAQRTVVF